MSNGLRTSVIGGVAALVSVALAAQTKVEPTNDAPNPYQTIEGWAKMPAGREWGSTSAVEIDKDGKVDLGRRTLRRRQPALNRAPTGSCPLDVVLHFDATARS
jgi:hypothetical protein